jgi:hypothetical protein
MNWFPNAALIGLLTDPNAPTQLVYDKLKSTAAALAQAASEEANPGARKGLAPRTDERFVLCRGAIGPLALPALT